MMAVAALCVLASGVQANPKPTPQPKTGTLIVYRPGEYVGHARTYAFSVDNGPVAT